jgi:hypothetical protein
MNVAPDQQHSGRWVVHLFAGVDGEEHIFHVDTQDAVKAARVALDEYSIAIHISSWRVVDAIIETHGAAPEYPESQGYTVSE